MNEARKIAIYNLSHFKEDTNYDDLSVKSKEAKSIEFIGFSDYINVLNTSIIKNDKDELFVRSRILWGFNHRLRNKEKENLFQNENDESIWNTNLTQLYELLDNSTDDKIIMKADICRTLGRFDESISLINTIQRKENFWVKEFFILECEKGNREVFNLSSLREKKDVINERPAYKPIQSIPETKEITNQKQSIFKQARNLFRKKDS